jgi:hypothetical protein
LNENIRLIPSLGKDPVANLVRYVPSGTYSARVRAGGKFILKSLRTDKVSVAQLRLNDPRGHHASGRCRTLGRNGAHLPGPCGLDHAKRRDAGDSGLGVAAGFFYADEPDGCTPVPVASEPTGEFTEGGVMSYSWISFS